jgi:hypothetical protein
MAQPFSLEKLARQVNLKGRKEKQQYFDKAVDDATFEAQKIIQKMQKQAGKKARGLFSGFGKAANILEPLSNVILNTIGNTIVPGLGTAMSVALSAGNLSKKQKQLQNQINKINQTGSAIPGKFKGTFLEDYLMANIGGTAGTFASSLENLKGKQKSFGNIGLALQALPLLGEIGKVSDLTKSVMKGGSSSDITDIVKATENIQGRSNMANKILESPFLTKAKSFADSLPKAIGPLNRLNVDLTGLGQPISESDNLFLQSLTTPSVYSNTISDALANALQPKMGDAFISPPEKPKFY